LANQTFGISIPNYENLYEGTDMQTAFKDDPILKLSINASRDYEDLFLGKRSGHLTEYMYCDDVDYYGELVQEEKDYYPTRSEISLINKHKDEIADIIGEDCNVIEVGPGPEYILKTKVIPLLSAFKNLSSYTALDINIDYALGASNFIKRELQVSCAAQKVDCTKQIQRYRSEKTCLIMLGGTLSNFTDLEINETVSCFANVLNKGEHLVFSVDCNEDLPSIERAYNNRMVELLTFATVRYFKDCFMIKDFDPTKFEFEYEWSYICNAVHLNLIATEEQVFYFNNKRIVIPKNKRYHMIRSKKFKKKFVEDVLSKHGLTIKKAFMDNEKRMMSYLIQK